METRNPEGLNRKGAGPRKTNRLPAPSWKGDPLLSGGRVVGCGRPAPAVSSRSRSERNGPSGKGAILRRSISGTTPLETSPAPVDRAAPVPPLSGGCPLVSSAPDQGSLQPTERALSKGPLPTEGRLPLRDRVPRQPHPSCLRPPHREEAALPVHEDRRLSPRRLPDLDSRAELRPFLAQADEGGLPNEGMALLLMT